MPRRRTAIGCDGGCRAARATADMSTWRARPSNEEVRSPMTGDSRTRSKPVLDAARPPGRYTWPACGELDQIGAALDDGRLSGGAPVVAAYEQALAAHFGVRRAVVVNSGSSALHAVLHVLGVRPGTEVLVPATAPLPTAMPILTCGATPVIVDTLPGSLALDPAAAEAKLSPRTRAAITLPLWGYPADDQPTESLLADAGVPVVEDACQAHGTRVRGRLAGTRGRAGCFSTHDRNLLATGEGGFVLTDDEELADRVDHFTRLGHLRGQVHGVNYKLAAPLAAIGLRRLGVLDDQLRQRRANAAQILAVLPEDGRLRELAYGPDDTPNYHTLVLTTDTDTDTDADTDADAIAAALATAGLPPDSVRYRYRPLPRRTLFQPHQTACPNAARLAATTFQLPVHPGMSEAAIRWVAGRIATLATSK
jgi:perosamine synthetase